MAFLAKLSFDGRDSEEDSHNVLECSFEFNTITDHRGRRAGHLRGGQITLLIESSKKDDFLQWMIDTKERRDGEIIFFRRDIMAADKKVIFKYGDCSHYSEEFNADGSIPMKTRLIISPHSIQIGDTEIELWSEIFSS